jgi:hypothetical protein
MPSVINAAASSFVFDIAGKPVMPDGASLPRIDWAETGAAAVTSGSRSKAALTPRFGAVRLGTGRDQGRVARRGTEESARAPARLTLQPAALRLDTPA